MSALAEDELNAAGLKPEAGAWDRVVSSASTAEPCGEKWADSDSEEVEAEAEGTAEDEEGAECSAVLSVSLALGVLLLAFLVCQCLPALVSAALLGFAALEITWFALGPSNIIPAGMSGFVLLPLYMCGWALFLACQTPQL
eukprot:CAMPEP_0113819290 /NCGR_PEP_ID=MMETSP0328-20130328/666_1 /TAXON_ID=39455 /ORGANISM="Alexandrium minutum" /LENGTH=140 /DNA_ID=CAMNT_0000787225 /DNA_START=83 /DNA_END=505 /DNA_ORIENTATION=+ /assembly_acc=CAM_ASM_000350